MCRHLHRSLSGLVLVGSRRPWPDPRDPGAADDANHGAALRGDQRLPGDRGCDQAGGCKGWMNILDCSGIEGDFGNAITLYDFDDRKPIDFR